MQKGSQRVRQTGRIHLHRMQTARDRARFRDASLINSANLLQVRDFNDAMILQSEGKLRGPRNAVAARCWQRLSSNPNRVDAARGRDLKISPSSRLRIEISFLQLLVRGSNSAVRSRTRVSRSALASCNASSLPSARSYQAQPLLRIGVCLSRPG